MKRKLSAGLTSVTVPIYVQDTSSTTGAGLSGLISATSGLVAEYRRQGQATWTAITLGAGTLGTWSSGGFVADGSLAGAYELGLPDAVCGTGARWVAIRLYGATNMLAVLIEIELDVVNYQSAASFITGINGLAPPANWNSMAIDGSGRIDLGKWLGNAVTVDAGNFPNVNARDWGGTIVGGMPNSGTVTLAAATHTGAVIPTVTTVTNAVTLPAAPAGYGGATAAQVAAAILVTPANLLATSAGGKAIIDTAQAFPVRNQDAVTAPTIADAMQGGWTIAFARESVVSTAYARRLPDNSGPARTFTLDSATAPTSRS